MKMKDDNGDGTIEWDGKDMFVVRSGIKIAKRKNKKWVSLMPGVTVRDFRDSGRQGIEIIFSGSQH